MGVNIIAMLKRHVTADVTAQSLISVYYALVHTTFLYVKYVLVKTTKTLGMVLPKIFSAFELS